MKTLSRAVSYAFIANIMAKASAIFMIGAFMRDNYLL
jgi:hypothetical protein